MKPDPLGVRETLATKAGAVRYCSLARLQEKGLGRIGRLPFSIKILLESLLRNIDGFRVTEEDVQRLAQWDPKGPSTKLGEGPLASSGQASSAGEIPFMPARVVLQDFTGVPCLVDLAAMRSALARMGKDPKRINPLVPCDLVIDHSVQVDAFGSPEALAINARKEFERNQERYEFLRWGAEAFDNFRLVPPATGIVHQVNLEYLARVVMTKKENGQTVAFPDSLVGTDSHTTMINGLGVLGWGVGGIEAEAVMLGQPMVMAAPQVIGFRLTGRLKEGATATDMVLTVTQMLRAKGVVDKFVEFFGPGLSTLPLPDRATLANMCPEYGATCAYFPVDQETLQYLKLTGRPPELVDLVERYAKAQGLFRTDETPVPDFTEIVELNLEKVEPSLAGPKRPQDRVSLSEAKKGFRKALVGFLESKLPPIEPGRLNHWASEGGAAVGGAAQGAEGTVPSLVEGPQEAIRSLTVQVSIELPSGKAQVGHGSVVIAAITSCTNTSNPSVMVGAGLLAKKAVKRGLQVKPHVKTSLSPGSRVVSEYLNTAGLTPYLEKLGFYTTGYGCQTCIGNSGPLPEPVAKAVKENGLVVAAVLSGNRNFEGRIHPQVKANYLASPMLVVAYALAGTMDIDLNKEPLGQDPQGRPVTLREIWPSEKEISEAILRSVTAEAFRKKYSEIFEGTEEWRSIPIPEGDLFSWDHRSTYIQEPPYFLSFSKEAPQIKPIQGARVIEFVGDSVTTDHISPAGSIAKDSPAGIYLISLGVEQIDFNSYGARRGNDRVMTRGTFANVRMKNRLCPEREGWWTVHQPSGEQMTVFDAAMRYQKEAIPLIVLAGKEYGSGSSRDWAAKGPALLGVKAVIAQSFERIHRSNLIGMGILPLEFLPGKSSESLGLTGDELYDISDLHDQLKPGQLLEVQAKGVPGETIRFKAKVRIDTPVELEYYRHGGILPYILRKFLAPPPDFMKRSFHDSRKESAPEAPKSGGGVAPPPDLSAGGGSAPPGPVPSP